MSEPRDPRSLINEQLVGIDQITIPLQDLSMGVVGDEVVFRVDPNNASLVFYYQRWKQEIYNRFREARKRFPEFFPCFELKYNLVEGLQYSIHFKPLTEHAKALTRLAPLFPHHEEFKPIERLWHSDGRSELDIIIEHFPTQLALEPPKQPWGTRLWELLLRLVPTQVLAGLSTRLYLRLGQ